MPISRRRPPLPRRTSSDPRRGSRSRRAQRERLLHAQSATPQHDNQRPQPSAVAIIGCLAHHRDDLLDGRRVGGIELPLVAGGATGVVARHGRGRSPPTGGIENWQDGHGISSQSHSGQSPRHYQHAGASRSSHVGDCASRFARAMRKPAACRRNARRSSGAGAVGACARTPPFVGEQPVVKSLSNVDRVIASRGAIASPTPETPSSWR